MLSGKINYDWTLCDNLLVLYFGAKIEYYFPNMGVKDIP